MARSVEDATRFTPTGPFASRPTSRSTILQFADPAPANETPQQKIARLRAAARKAKLAEESTFDRMVSKGRVFVDKAHRAGIYGVMAFSAIAGGVTLFSVVEMVIHNRHKRKEWLAEMREKHAGELAVARQALNEGIANEDQMLLLNREKLAEDARVEKEQRGGFFKQTKTLLFGSSSKEEEPQGKLVDLAKEVAPEAQLGGSSQERGEGLGIVTAVEASRESREQATGGPLDHTAEETAQAVKTTSKGWISWITGR